MRFTKDDKTPLPPSRNGINHPADADLDSKAILNLDLASAEDPISRETDPEGLLRPLEKPEEP